MRNQISKMESKLEEARRRNGTEHFNKSAVDKSKRAKMIEKLESARKRNLK